MTHQYNNERVSAPAVFASGQRAVGYIKAEHTTHGPDPILGTEG